MQANRFDHQALLEKIASLTPQRHAEVEDFVDFLRQRELDHALTFGASRLAEGSFSQVWENDDDAEYDKL